MHAHLAVLGTFPDTGMIHVCEIGFPGAGGEPSTRQGSAVDRKWIGMLLAAAFPISSPALAQAKTMDPTTVQPASQPAPVAPAAAAAPLPPSLGPSMTGPLHLNSSPLHVDGGPLGPIYVSCVSSGLGLVQGHPFPGDHDSRVDLGNGQVIVQNTQGVLQFWVQTDGYSIPTLGTPCFKATGLGPNFNDKSQVRGLIEAGIIF